ncbi:hypothetical protein EMIT043CA1_90121 [Pseudomonas brassicacearum]
MRAVRGDHGQVTACTQPCGEGISVGARLARDEGDAVLQKSSRLYRGQALLPHNLYNQSRSVAKQAQQSLTRRFQLAGIWLGRGNNRSGIEKQQHHRQTHRHGVGP